MATLKNDFEEIERHADLIDYAAMALLAIAAGGIAALWINFLIWG